jgi:misacylated tRNA(Ala) deacylase
MTEPLFRADSYARKTRASVVDAGPGRIVLDATIFYPQGGGQSGDRGTILLIDDRTAEIGNTVYDIDRKTIIHVAADGAPLPSVGETVTMQIDWETRYLRMRAHTALHLLSVALPYPVTGGSVGDGEGRLDFDSGDAAFDRVEIEQRLNELIATDAQVTTRWISDEELAAHPELVKTMKVKPPTGQGRVRLVEIAGLDLQPCGGTHVSRLSEIGHAEVTGIEKKGKQNRRVRIKLPA